MYCFVSKHQDRLYTNLNSFAFLMKIVCLLLHCCFVQAALATEPLAIDLGDVPWGAPGGGSGFPVGVRTARQSADADTGGITYYAMFPAGSHFDLHWHTHDEYVVVVAGELFVQLGEQTYTLSVGSYVVIPGELPHSWKKIQF